MLEPIIRDLRYAFRMLRKTPGFTVVALVTLAVGIGVNTAVFTVVNALLLKPLPFPEPGRLATVTTFSRSPRGSGENSAVDGKTFLAIHENAATVDTAVSKGRLGGGKDQNVVGLHIRTAGAEREIVGVVANARATSSGLASDGSPLVIPFVVYVPATQTSGGFFKQVHMWFSPSWVVRSSGPIAGLAGGVRQSVAAVDPMLPIAKMESMADVQAASLAKQRFMMSVVLGLGGVALLLAAIGIHGLIASSVSERTRELGIRLALGATGRQVIKDVVMPGIILAGVGVALGSVASLAAVRLLQSFLWGVTATDPLTFGVVVVTLLAVALFASVIPALRVLRLDPALTLRAE